MRVIAKLGLLLFAAAAAPVWAGTSSTPEPEVQGGLIAFALMSAGYYALRRRSQR